MAVFQSPTSACSLSSIEEIPDCRLNQAGESSGHYNQSSIEKTPHSQAGDASPQSSDCLNQSSIGHTQGFQMNQGESSQSSSLAQSSIYSQSSSQSWKRLSDYCTPDEEVDGMADVDLTCVDVLSDDDDELVIDEETLVKLEPQHTACDVIAADEKVACFWGGGGLDILSFLWAPYPCNDLMAPTSKTPVLKPVAASLWELILTLVL